jgi:hypothetical protein
MLSIAHIGRSWIDAGQEARVLAVLVGRWSRFGQPSPQEGSNRSKGKTEAALSGVVALGLMAWTPAPQGNFDCGKAYKSFWERLDHETYTKMQPEQLVALSRRALRIYNACQTGDVHDVKALFETLERPAN